MSNSTTSSSPDYDPDEVLYCSTVNGTDQFRYLLPIYQIIIPIMLTLCVVSFIGNLVILCTGFFVRKKHLNPTLMFSLSLAGADAVAAFAIGTGLFINNILELFLQIRLYYSDCITLIVEAFRLGAMVTSALHFLILAMNHWIGITQPLHYASRMTRKTAVICIAIMWLLPCFTFFVYFASVTDEGFQSGLCEYTDFAHRFAFRMVVFTLLATPLAVMSLVYLHVFLVMSLHQRNMNTLASADEKRRLQSNTKALVTTLIILVTYLIGWLPAVINYVLVCLDCAYNIKFMSLCVRLPVNLVTNFLIQFKFLVDPIIYTARIQEVRMVIKHFVEVIGLKKRPNAKMFDMNSEATQTTSLNRSIRYSTYRHRKDSDISILQGGARNSQGRASLNSVASVRRTPSNSESRDYSMKVPNGNGCYVASHSPLVELSETSPVSDKQFLSVDYTPSGSRHDDALL